MLRKIAKLVFNLVPFKKFIFLFIKSIHVPSQKIYQHLVFKGPFKVFSGTNSFRIYNTATIIENQLFWKGLDGFEPESLKLWAKLSKNANTILDIGANSGIYTLIAKSENPTSKVFAFECVDRVFEVLKKNISLNNYDAICYKQAVSDRDGVGYFFDDDEAFTNSVVVGMDIEETASGRGLSTNELHKVETDLITLDSFIQNNNIDSIDLMKIDVETHEPEVFAGFQKNLKEFKPTLLVEIIRDHVADALDEQLADLGYIYFYINEPFGGVDEVTTGKIYQKVDKLHGGTFGNYLICSPEKARELNLL
jgi:FkbM family methyltransferase